MNSKNPKKQKRLKLDMIDEINFSLIGISSPENDYRLVWAINRALKFNFIRSENLLVHHVKFDQELSFSRFQHDDEERFLTYYFISNRSPEGILFPELRNIDFFIQIIGEANETFVQQMIKDFREMKVITGAYVIDSRKIKDVRKICTD